MKIQSAIEMMMASKRGHTESVPVGERTSHVAEYYDELMTAIKNKPEIMNLFEQFIDALEENHCNETDDFYKEGFRFGVLLGMDILSTD